MGRPNIVLILADDLGYGDLGCYGNPVTRTPQLDRLAAEGLRFTDFYASAAWCVPSRAGLMTGCHPYRPDMMPWQASSFPVPTMAGLLREAGYATALVGKWHLGTAAGCHPLDAGFDTWYGTPGSNDNPAPSGRKHDYDLFRTCDRFTFPIELTRDREVVECPADQELFLQRYTEEAKGWIREHADGPFFLYLAYNAPHVPVFPSEAFKGRSRGGRYGDVVEELDWSVGEVLQTLEEEGLRGNTLVVFTSDNGPWTMFWEFGGTAHPLRGEKATCWEGGPRVPAIVSMPGRIRPGVSSEFVVGLDLYATFAALAGARLPDHPIDSVDLSALLFEGGGSPRDSYLFYAYHRPFAYRSGRHKLVTHSIERMRDPHTCERSPVTEYDPPLLFDLSTDISEKRDLSAECPGVVEDLIRAYGAAVQRIGEQGKP